MKRLFSILIILFVCYVGIQTSFKIFGNGHTVNYKITSHNNTFKIHEVYSQKMKNDKNNYHFEITLKNTQFSFTTYYNFKRKDLIIKKIEYYKDDKYECILPIFKGNKIVTDVMCINNNIIYPYHTIQNKDSKLDKYIKTLKKYDINNFKNDTKPSLSQSTLKVYSQNIPLNLHFAINNYKGVYLFNKNSIKLYNIKLFDEDVYNQKILTSIKNNYIIADYNESYDFNNIYIVNIQNAEYKKIKSPEISMDSYIQGTVKNSAYLIDRDAKKQYEININTKTITEVGNDKKGSKFYDGKNFINNDFNETLNTELYFEKNIKTISMDGYEKVDIVGNAKTGYYYYYKKISNKYTVYRAPLQSPDKLTYLFSVTSYNQIQYIGDYVYLIDKNKLIVFQDQIGKRIIAIDTEFEFNKDLHYYIYQR